MKNTITSASLKKCNLAKQAVDGCDLSIIIVAYNVKDLVERCLTCLSNSCDTLKKEIIFVDNGSSDGTAELIKAKFPSVKCILSPINLGFIKANNLGYQSAAGKYILLLNSDAFVKENTLQILVDFMEKTQDCGVLGCNAIDGNGNRLASARYFPTPWRIFLTNLGLAGKIPFSKDINDMKENPNVIHECDWVTGCCLLTKREIIESLGVLLRPQLFMYNDDNDLCLRVKRKGRKVYFHPETITHLAGANNNKISREEKDRLRLERLTLESDYIYFRRNYGIFKVFLHFLLLTLFHAYTYVKSCILFRKDQRKNSLASLSLSAKTLKETHFGNVDINRLRLVYSGKGITAPKQKTLGTSTCVDKIIQGILHGSPIKKDLFTKEVLRAIFLEKNPKFLESFKNLLQTELDNLKDNLPKTKEEELVWRGFLGHVISLVPYAYPQDGEEIIIPFLEDGTCCSVKYDIHVIDLTPTILFSPMKALGLTPVENKKAPPILTFLATTYPAGDGFAATIFSDFTPGYSVGKVAFNQGKKKIGKWLQNQSRVHLTGVSLGGTLALHTLNAFYDKFQRIDIHNSPGLYPHDWKKTSFNKGCDIHIFSQSGDIVSKLGNWPEGEKVHLYLLKGGQDGLPKGMISSHLRAFKGLEKLSIHEKDPHTENRSFSRKMLTFLHRFIAPLLIFIPCLLIYGIYSGIKMIRNGYTRARFSRNSTQRRKDTKTQRKK